MSKPTFVSGLELSQSFYLEAVKPVLREEFPDLHYSAALIGPGSEVLGFDTEMSSDHHWGPRVMIFVREVDLTSYKDKVVETLSLLLPRRFKGYPTNFTSEGADRGVQLLEYTDEGPVNHRVEVLTTEKFFRDYIGLELVNELSVADWLSIPEQKLCSLVAGRVFDDGIDLEKVRARFAYYPPDVWLYLLACQWTRIEQEEHLMGRAAVVGDEIGSAIIAARLVRDLMRLCFLIDKTYAPYPKWFGTAFLRLASAAPLAPILSRILVSPDWREREKHLSDAYEYVARLHNLLRITEPLPDKVSQFHDRPFLTISQGIFSNAIVSKIADPAVFKLAKANLIGSVDQFSDSTDLLSNARHRKSLSRLYEIEDSAR